MTRSRQRYCSSRSPGVKRIDGTTARQSRVVPFRPEKRAVLAPCWWLQLAASSTMACAAARRRGAPWRQLAPVEPAPPEATMGPSRALRVSCGTRRGALGAVCRGALCRRRLSRPSVGAALILAALHLGFFPTLEPRRRRACKHAATAEPGRALQGGSITLSRAVRPPSQPSAVLQRWLDVEVSRRSFERRTGGRRGSSCRSRRRVARQIRKRAPGARLRGFFRARYSLVVAPSGTRASVRGRRKGTTSQ